MIQAKYIPILIVTLFALFPCLPQKKFALFCICPILLFALSYGLPQVFCPKCVCPIILFALFYGLPQGSWFALFFCLPYFMVCPKLVSLRHFIVCPILWFALHKKIGKITCLPYFMVCPKFFAPSAFALFYCLPYFMVCPKSWKLAKFLVCPNLWFDLRFRLIEKFIKLTYCLPPFLWIALWRSALTVMPSLMNCPYCVCRKYQSLLVKSVISPEM